MGYRFRIHVATLPGTPDIVLPRHRTVVQVHGCFFHRHPGCRYAYEPKSNVERWQQKFGATTLRDSRVEAELMERGWRVVTVWECETNDFSKLAERLSTVLRRDDATTGQSMERSDAR